MSRTALLGDEIVLAYGKGLPKRTRTPGAYPVFGSNGRVGTHTEYLVTGPGIIVGRKGTVGEVIWSDQDFWPIDTTYYIKLKNESDSLSYWYYQLKMLGLNHLNSHSAIPGLNRDVAYAKQVIKRSPAEQKKIADVLGLIDENIKVNQKNSETLMQIGRALYRHYFIQDSVTDMVPLSNYVEHLKVNVAPGKEPSTKYSQYSIPAYDNLLNPEQSIGSEIMSGKYQVTANSILVSKLNPATSRIWAVFEPERNAVCSTEFQVIKPRDFFAFSYFLLTSREFTDKMTMSAGGTSNSHKRVKPDDILSYSFLKPKEEMLVKFETETIPLLKMINENREKIQTLAELRDTLLPLLISGKIKL